MYFPRLLVEIYIRIMTSVPGLLASSVIIFVHYGYLEQDPLNLEYSLILAVLFHGLAIIFDHISRPKPPPPPEDIPSNGFVLVISSTYYNPWNPLIILKNVFSILSVSVFGGIFIYCVIYTLQNS